MGKEVKTNYFFCELIVAVPIIDLKISVSAYSPIWYASLLEAENVTVPIYTVASGLSQPQADQALVFLQSTAGEQEVVGVLNTQFVNAGLGAGVVQSLTAKQVDNSPAPSTNWGVNIGVGVGVGVGVPVLGGLIAGGVLASRNSKGGGAPKVGGGHGKTSTTTGAGEEDQPNAAKKSTFTHRIRGAEKIAKAGVQTVRGGYNAIAHRVVASKPHASSLQELSSDQHHQVIYILYDVFIIRTRCKFK